MCNTCGCNITPGNRHLISGEGKFSRVKEGGGALSLLRGLLTANDEQANHNRDHLNHHATLAINLMSSPGAGKTRLLEATIEALRDEMRIAVIEGDLETENDAERIRAKGVTAIQIATGTACHLDAHMVHQALHDLPLEGIDLLFIENVGNLVCPASFDLGHHRNVILLSVVEGADKPAKYPVMFRAADLMVISKLDLLPFMDDFDPAAATQALRHLACDAPVLTLSARSGDGMAAWFDWLRQQVALQRQQLANHHTLRPTIAADPH
jgi:hydrogenase nickel incorporation protein HypB